MAVKSDRASLPPSPQIRATNRRACRLKSSWRTSISGGLLSVKSRIKFDELAQMVILAGVDT
jgi:hypothetical protein